MLMSAVDTMVVGRSSAMDMAGVALGGGVVNTVGVFGVGVAMGIEALVGQAQGAGEPRRARGWMWQGVHTGLWVALPLVLLLALSPRLFVAYGINPALAEAAGQFIYGRLLSVPAYTVMASLRAYLSNVGRRWPIVVAVALANVINLIVDLVLVYGWLGAPRLGALGVGISTSISTIVMAAVMAYAIRLQPALPYIPGPDTPEIAVRRDLSMMRRVLSIGWPVGMQAAVENGVFMAAAWMIGTMGDQALAAHSVALTLASLTFMMVIGIANAATARVGHYVGATDSTSARRAGLTAIGVGSAFMSMTGLSFMAFPALLARLFTDDLAVVEAAVPLVRMAGLFAISDGIQGVAAGALRGIGETTWPFWANLFAHWVVGFPLGVWLGTFRGLGPLGYWWGLSAGLTGVAVILLLRFHLRTLRPLARLETQSALPPPELPAREESIRP